MKIHRLLAPITALTIGLVLSSLAYSDELDWDQSRVTALAKELDEGLSGLRDEMRSVSQDLGSGRAAAYYRLLDNLRVLERETRHLHRSLESGAPRIVTLPTYRRITMLRRDCAEEMERQFLSKTALERISRARTIIEKLNPYYGFEVDHTDHERVLDR